MLEFNYAGQSIKLGLLNYCSNVKQIEKTIKQTIQNTLNSLEKDSDLVISHINNKLKKDKYEEINNNWSN